MAKDISAEEFNEYTHLKWTVLPNAPTDLLVEELSKRDGVWSRKLGDGERVEIYGPYHLIAVR